jgi:hypothetical protein
MKDFDRYSSTVAQYEFPEGVLFFKQCTDTAYSHFFEATTILDCLNLCVQVWQYSPRVVALAVL